jgi:hypothetical protein
VYEAVGVMIIGRERLKFWKKYLPQCHLVYPGIEDGRARGKASD